MRRKPECFFGELFGHAFELEHDLAGLDDGDPFLGLAFTFAHAGFKRLLRYRLGRESVAPDLAAALDLARQRDAGRFGQRIAAFAIQARVDGTWREIARATTIGYKRLLRIDPVTADRVRLVIEDAVMSPALSGFGLFEASPAERRD